MSLYSKQSGPNPSQEARGLFKLTYKGIKTELHQTSGRDELFQQKLYLIPIAWAGPDPSWAQHFI